ncbi:MAG: histone deacetylase family protein [Thermodesulfobacteriota bacterium]
MAEPVIVFHPRYLERYPTTHVECPERAGAVYEALSLHYQELRPEPAGLEDLARVHTRRLIAAVEREDLGLYEAARLAAGGALLAAREAVAGRPAFGVIRPPGHHASPDSHWGFCFFNNMAVALAALLFEGRIKTAFVLDFDLHFGDGTVNYFQGRREVTVFNPQVVPDRAKYVASVRRTLSGTAEADLIGVSAGFDLGENDWGALLTAGDYEELGRLVKEAAGRLGQGRRFALLEGGYHIPDLGKNALAFCRGFF